MLKIKEDKSNSKFISPKYENIVSISSLFFLKSIKIMAKEEKNKKRTEQSKKKKALWQQILPFSQKHEGPYTVYLTHRFL